jgi:hypothetical protein
VRDGLKMPRVDAARITTQVIDDKTSWNRTDVVFVREPMSSDEYASQGEASITEAGTRPAPLPAPVRNNIHFAHEALDWLAYHEQIEQRIFTRRASVEYRGPTSNDVLAQRQQRENSTACACGVDWTLDIGVRLYMERGIRFRGPALSWGCGPQILVGVLRDRTSVNDRTKDLACLASDTRCCSRAFCRSRYVGQGKGPNGPMRALPHRRTIGA